MKKAWMMRRVSIGVGIVAVLCVQMSAAEEPAARRDVRVWHVPGSAILVTVWNQEAERGLQPYYAIAFDGQVFSPAQATSYQILVTDHEFEAGRDDPVVPRDLAAGADTNLYFVQFYTQPLDVYRAQLQAAGAVVGRYVAHNALAVQMTPAVRDQVAVLPYVRWVGACHPAYKLSPEIRGQWAATGVEGGVERYSIEVLQRGLPQQAAVAQRVGELGGTVHFTTPDGYRMEATLSRAALVQLVRMDEINYVDPWGGPGEPDMDIARGPAGFHADYIETLLGFRGQGVRGEVFDTGLRVTHHAFQNPAPLLHTMNQSDTSHGTSTYGEVFGNGADDAQGTGMLPGREQGIFAYYGQVTMHGGSKPRWQHTQELVDPNGPYQAVFQTSSVGSTQTTSYTSVSAEVDQYLFDYDLLSTQSQSNKGNTLSRPQAWAKNIVSIGGFYHFDNLDRSDDRWDGGFTKASIGPASDGRIKPDLTAYYDLIYTTGDGSDSAYIPDFCCTSGATPMTAGAFGILFQMWHAGVWPGHGGGTSVFDSRCHMATAKALMINSAHQYPLAGEPAYTDLTRVRQGWGMANLENLYHQAAKSIVIDETDILSPLQTSVYLVKVDAAEPTLKATMVYTDLPGNPLIQSQHRINDLTLRVTAPNATYYYGNSGLSTGRWSTAGGSADTKNTVENVFLQSPAAGIWKVEVIGAEIVGDTHPETPAVTDADYALVVTGATEALLGDLNCDGVLDFDDISPFVLALSDPAGYAVEYPACSMLLGDIDGSGVVNFDDINPFVEFLSR